ncbi:hypothetical protein NQ314_003370 [Rhamnusium bicolor]|uniref:Uncharacterized protein n=1 Tax=Rhamnusium bicolor TaxID=1586634 RepID=A0AAV8ZMZ1_9CUCU|nr:hypothetical protein NQ314_003370 [Rhamnusium bicolor]
MINNTNVINSPIRLNLNNTNDMLINGTVNFNTKRRKRCCSIVHPQECHNIKDIPKPICFTRRHIECSELCRNSTNILIKNGSKVSKCIVIAAHPYYYCGYYALEDCSPCYHCKRQNKTECLEESTCSTTCKSSVLPKNFYNVPYYIKTPEESATTEEPGLPPSQ